MNRIVTAVVSLVLLTGIVACKTRNAVQKNEAKKTKTIIKVQRKTEIARPEKDDLQVTGMNIKGDIATLFVTYSGGCNQHTFNAYFNGMYMKSLPPRATVFIEHLDNGDACRQLVSDTLYIDLTDVRMSREKPGTVIVGFNGTEKTLEYQHD